LGTLFPGLAATNRALPYLAFKHRVVVSTSSSKLVAGKNMPDINEQKTDGKSTENNQKEGPEGHIYIGFSGEQLW